MSIQDEHPRDWKIRAVYCHYGQRRGDELVAALEMSESEAQRCRMIGWAIQLLPWEDRIKDVPKPVLVTTVITEGHPPYPDYAFPDELADLHKTRLYVPTELIPPQALVRAEPRRLQPRRPDSYVDRHGVVYGYVPGRGYVPRTHFGILVKDTTVSGRPRMDPSPGRQAARIPGGPLITGFNEHLYLRARH